MSGGQLTFGTNGAVIFDDSVPADLNNIRSNRADQSPIVNTKDGITNLGSETAAGPGATDNYATIGGGLNNTVSAEYGTVAGGRLNVAGGTFAASVGGGYQNQALADNATVAGGQSNVCTANGDRGSIGGGIGNTVDGTYGTISGGQDNRIDRLGAGDPAYCAIGGGQGNGIESVGNHNTIAGGLTNAIGPTNGAVGKAVISGGESNTINSGSQSVIAGGFQNTITTGTRSFIGGGTLNAITAATATISGGQSNVASGVDSAIAGGNGNIASGVGAFAMGTGVTATGSNSAALGRSSNALRGSQLALAGDRVTVDGDSQTSVMHVRGNTPGAGAGETVDLIDSYGNATIVLEDGKTYAFKVTAACGGVIAAVRTSRSIEIEFNVRRDAGLTVITASGAGASYGDAGAATWTLTPSVGAGPDRIIVQFSTGATTAASRVSARMEFTETVY